MTIKVEAPKVLTVSEVAALFSVAPETVKRWANEGRLPYFRTLGGHRRFREVEVLALLNRGEEA